MSAPTVVATPSTLLQPSLLAWLARHKAEKTARLEKAAPSPAARPSGALKAAR